MRKSFYLQDTVEAARQLLGKLLVHRTPEGAAGGMIVETEAYVGAVDKACHTYNGISPRTEIMFAEGGVAYVYLIYGMYHCFNAVTGPAGEGDAVLIRALEPVFGLDLMRRRRGQKDLRKLCSGPGKLCQALAIGKPQYGLDLTGEELFIADFRIIPEELVARGPRINVDYAEEAVDFPWRFRLRDSKYVSRR